MAKTDEKGAEGATEDTKSKDASKPTDKGAEGSKAQPARSTEDRPKVKETRAWYRLKPGLKHVVLTEDGEVDVLEPGDEIELSPAGVKAFGDKFEKV